MTVSWLRVLSVLFLHVCVSENDKPEQGDRSGSWLLEGPGLWRPGTGSLQGWELATEGTVGLNFCLCVSGCELCWQTLSLSLVSWQVRTGSDHLYCSCVCESSLWWAVSAACVCAAGTRLSLAAGSQRLWQSGCMAQAQSWRHQIQPPSSNHSPDVYRQASRRSELIQSKGSQKVGWCFAEVRPSPPVFLQCHGMQVLSSAVHSLLWII